MQLIKKVFLGAILLSMAHLSMAACKRTNQSPQEVNVSFGTIVVPSNLGVGEVIKTIKTESLNNNYYYSNCPGPSAKEYLIGKYMNSEPVYHDYAAIPTGVPGIGLRIIYTKGSYSGSFDSINNNIIVTTTPRGTKDNYWIALNGATVTVELVKTGDIGSGQLNKLTSATGELYLNTSDKPMVIVKLGGLATTIVQHPSCEVKIEGHSNLNVILPPAPLSSFKRLGATENRIPFLLNVKCFNGSQYDNRTVKVKFNPGDGQLTEGIAGLLKNDAESKIAAKNIGVQVLVGSTPINFDNMYYLGFLDERGFDINYEMGVRYYQYGNDVTAGKVSGKMTYDINYY